LLGANVVSILADKRPIRSPAPRRVTRRLTVRLLVAVPDPVAVRRNLVQVSTGPYAERLFFQNVATVCRPGLVIPLFEEEPLALIPFRAMAAGTNQHPAALELIAMQMEFQSALAVVLVSIPQGLPCTTVPEEDGAATILSFGNDALKLAVLDRV